MKEPQRIKLTNSPENKKVTLIPLPALEMKYSDEIYDDIYIRPLKTHEDNQKNNSESIQPLESNETN